MIQETRFYISKMKLKSMKIIQDIAGDNFLAFSRSRQYGFGII